MKKKHWQVSVFDKTSEIIRDDTFYTTDTKSYLVFELIDEDFTPDSASVTVYNTYGKVTIHVTRLKVVDGIVHYEMPVEAIRHLGDWRTQVVFTKDNEDYTTEVIEFDVGGHLLDNKKPPIVYIENWNHFVKHGERLIDDWKQLEKIRQANERQRERSESVRQTKFETNETERQNEFETNEGERESAFEERYGQLEEEYAPKLTELTTQLAQTFESVENIGNEMKESYNEHSYTLGFLKGLNLFRNREIIEVNGFYKLDDGAEGKYRVLPVSGNETWENVMDSSDGSVLFQISNELDIRAEEGTKKLRAMDTRGFIRVKMFGVKGDGYQDDTLLLQKVAEYNINTPLRMDSGDRYLISRPISFPHRTKLFSEEPRESTPKIIPTTDFIGDYLMILNKRYNHVKGITFDGNNRNVSGIRMGVEVYVDDNTVPHSSIIEDCVFNKTDLAIDGKLSCGVFVEKCKFEQCHTGIRLDRTANTWYINYPVFFNFHPDISDTCINVVNADQVNINGAWSELNAVPFLKGDKFSNITIENTWLEHLRLGNISPLIEVSNLSSTNLVIKDSDLINIHHVLIDANVNDVYLNNVRVDGISPEKTPVIEAHNTVNVYMNGVRHGYRDNPQRKFDNIIVNGGVNVKREYDEEVVFHSHGLENNVPDSSFKNPLLNNVTVDYGSPQITHDNTIGVYDNNSLKVSIPTDGCGVRIVKAKTLNVGDHVRVSVWLWSDSDEMVRIGVGVAGVTSGSFTDFPINKTPRKFSFIWKVPEGANGFYHVTIRKTGPSHSFNLWVDDVQMVVDQKPIPDIPYVMNNNENEPVRIGKGVNITEHTLFGKHVTYSDSIPNSGIYRIGDMVYNTKPTIDNPVGYWLRITDGSSHTIGTDWIEK